MARLQCRGCGFDDEVAWDGRLVCPRCRSSDCRVAVSTVDLPDSVLERLAASLDELASDDDDPED